MTNRKSKVQLVVVWEDRRGADYQCYDRHSDMYTFGQLRFGRVISSIEAQVLRRRLEGVKYGRIDSIVYEVLDVRVEMLVDFGDQTPQLDV